MSKSGHDEFDYGSQFGTWTRVNDTENLTLVDVDKMAHSTVDIPEDDYRAMRKDGIESPDPRKYWQGFNSIVKLHNDELSKAASALGRKGRAVNSPAQQQAARENGKKGGRPRNNRTPRCHRDGTVSYWSVYRQSFVSRADGISDEELAAMNQDDRERVIAHIQPARKG